MYYSNYEGKHEKSFYEAKEGKGEPIDKLFDKLEAKYKWL